MDLTTPIQEFLKRLVEPLQLGLNGLDLLILFVIVFYAYEGIVLGFSLAALDLLSFILSFFLALKFYGLLAMFLGRVFAIPLGFANALGFFFVALLAEILLNLLIRKLFKFLPRISAENKFFKTYKKLDHFLGILPGIVSAGIILSFLLSVIIALPSSPFLKQVVASSKIGSYLVANTAFMEKKLNDIFGGALHETLTFFTVEPKSTESVQLNFKVANGSVDSQAEEKMLRLLNLEREKKGFVALKMDPALRGVARAHSQDMFQKGYFSHYNLEGQSPFDRMNQAGIEYGYAGENLALAPSTDLAMQGLMNSPGHRANILKPEFRKIGIGVIDGGIYGKMFSQEFTD